MRQEVVRLKQQLQNISMVDQFASYARIQRKINSLNQQYKAKGTVTLWVPSLISEVAFSYLYCEKVCFICYILRFVLFFLFFCIWSVNERSIGEKRVQMTVGGLIKAVVGMLCTWLVWENFSEPVVTLPGTLVWPLGPLLSFPSCQLGQVRK